MSTERRDHWKEKLSESREALFALLNGLSPEQWQTAVFAEGDTWTVATVVAHLVESERGMSIHVHKIRKGEATIPDDFDLDRWNAGLTRRTGDIAPEELMASADATRAKTLEVMDSLEEGENVVLSITGRSVEGSLESLRASAGAWKGTHDPEVLKENIYSRAH
ncbi:MAG: maleylpyruvate isomerase N-terminal domain-containing protein [Caldilineaceae bacterium]|nr:maleylpyruvate isomerase N-terminal domain-containing protein [Caldilineaceae bacterium]